MKRNTFIILSLFTLFCLTFSGAVLATPSTHIWAPSTDVQTFGKWHITADMYLAAEKDAAGNLPAPVTNLGLTVGFLPFDKIQGEIGFDHKSGLGILDNNPFYFNVKLGSPEGVFGEMFPALAVGIFDAGTEKDKTDNNVIYGKVAKSLALSGTDLGRFSLGYFRGNPATLLDKSGLADNKGILLAWERTMKEISDKLWVCVEYMGSSSAYGTLNLGFSWNFSETTSLLIGYDIYNNNDLANTLTVQTDINF